MPFAVYEEGKPCSVIGYPHLRGHGWENHTFPTFEQAHEHALNWLGPYWEGAILEKDKPYCYNGFDSIVIREEPYMDISENPKLMEEINKQASDFDANRRFSSAGSVARSAIREFLANQSGYSFWPDK